jgi:protease IV
MLDRIKSVAGTGLFLLFLFAVMALSATGLDAQASDAETKTPDMVEIIELNGEISDATANSVRDQVKQINASKAVKAVVLVVDSPGGSVLPTSVIYEELSKIKVPVVAYCHYICASGGVFAMMAPSVKYIGVRQDTISGSVGVIMQVTNYKQLLDKIGVGVETYKSGNLKDSGNGARPQTDEDRKYLQGIVDQLATRFYDVVGKSRKIKDWPAVKSARIFIGEDAVKVGLADGIMSRDQAIQKAKQLSGSKVIYTRDEMKEISKMADSYGSRYTASKLTVYEEGLGFLLMQAREIRRVEEVSFSYRMPLRF